MWCVCLLLTQCPKPVHNNAWVNINWYEGSDMMRSMLCSRRASDWTAASHGQGSSTPKVRITARYSDWARFLMLRIKGFYVETGFGDKTSSFFTITGASVGHWPIVNRQDALPACSLAHTRTQKDCMKGDAGKNRSSGSIMKLFECNFS